MASAMRDPNETRRLMNSLPTKAPIIIDNETGRIIVEGAQPLTYPPAVTNVTSPAIPDTHALVLIPSVLPSPPIIQLPDTLPAKIRESFACGEGIVISMAAGWIGLAVYTGLSIYWWTLAAVHSIMANLAVIAANGLIALAVIAGVLMLLRGKKSGGNFVDLKGCMKGATPGHVRLWLD